MHSKDLHKTNVTARLSIHGRTVFIAAYPCASKRSHRWSGQRSGTVIG